jgi:hypothetical protein
MNRRNVIQLGIGATMGVALGSGLIACASQQDRLRAAVPAGRDPRLRILSYALLAPSSHNTQPWRLRLVGSDSAEVFVDPARLLPCVDPNARQTLISHGAFVEAAAHSAAALGYRCQVRAFPDGANEGKDLLSHPVARLRFERALAPSDPVALEVLRKRQTNKRAYDDRPIAPGHLMLIAALGRRSGMAARSFIDPAFRAKIVDLCERAMGVEVASEARNRELSNWFRLGSEERRARDGFGLGQSGLTGVERWMAETFFVSRKGMIPAGGSFARTAVDKTSEQARSAPAFVALNTESNDPLAQFEAGRAFMRMHLCATRLGIQMHPLSQATEEYDDMRDMRHALHRLVAPKGQTVQMLLRLGYADPVEYAPRRDVETLLMEG